MSHEEALTITLLALRRIAAESNGMMPPSCCRIAAEALEQIDSDPPAFTEESSSTDE